MRVRLFCRTWRRVAVRTGEAIRVKAIDSIRVIPIDLKAFKSPDSNPIPSSPGRVPSDSRFSLFLFLLFFTLRHTDLEPSSRYRALGLLFVVLGKFPSGCTGISRRRLRPFPPLRDGLSGTLLGQRYVIEPETNVFQTRLRSANSITQPFLSCHAGTFHIK